MRLIQPLGRFFFPPRIGRFPEARVICIRRYRPPALELLLSRIGARCIYPEKGEHIIHRKAIH